MASLGAVMVVAGVTAAVCGVLGMREGRPALLMIVLSGALLAALGGGVLIGARQSAVLGRSRRVSGRRAGAEGTTAGATGDVGADHGARDHGSDTERSGWWGGGDSGGGWSGGDSGGGGGDSGGGF